MLYDYIIVIYVDLIFEYRIRINKRLIYILTQWYLKILNKIDRYEIYTKQSLNKNKWVRIIIIGYYF